jgi:oligopeptide transport system permease protein
MMRIVDILYAIPVVLYVILLMVVLGNGLQNIFIALGISYWSGMARMVRGQVLQLKEREFILAAKAIGSKDPRIIRKHLLPNAMGQIIVMLTMSIPQAIFTEAFLSFIGLGVSAPAASLGMLCNDAIASFRTYPYQLFFPAAVICLIMLAFNLFGDGLRDALDPKMRK